MATKTVVGTVVREAAVKTTANGKTVAEFAIKDKDKIYDVTAWEDIAEQTRTACKLNEKLIITLWVKIQGDETTYTAKMIKAAEAGPTRDQMIIQEYGSIEAYHEHKQAIREAREKDGYVEIWYKKPRYKCWCKKEDCVEIAGKWHNKMEYITDILGAEVIKAEFGGFGGVARLLAGAQFREKRDQLVKDCQALMECEYKHEGQDE